MLGEAGISYRRSQDYITINWETDEYRDAQGDGDLLIAVTLSEEGEYFELSAPNAFILGNANTGAFLKACTIIQGKTKLIRFEYNPEDGEVRPSIEFPLEDAQLTPQQLIRCITGMLDLIDHFYPILERAQETGRVQLPEH